MKLDLEQIKADRAVCRDESATDEQRFWARNNRENRLPDMEAALIELSHALQYARNLIGRDEILDIALARFQCAQQTPP